MMKTKILTIILCLTLIISTIAIPAFADTHIRENINFNNLQTGSWNVMMEAEHGVFTEYENGHAYPTGGNAVNQYRYFSIDDTVDRLNSGKSLNLYRMQQVNSQANPGITYTLSEPITDVFYFETSVYIPSAEGYTLYSPRNIMISGLSHTSPKTLIQFTEAGGRFQIYNGTDTLYLTEATGPTWSPDIWYDVKIWFDLAQNKIRYNISSGDTTLYNLTYKTSYDNEAIATGIAAVHINYGWNFKKLYTEINTKKLNYSPKENTYIDNFFVESQKRTVFDNQSKIIGDIYEDFESHAVTSYNGGNGLQSNVKSATGGSQQIVDGSDGKEVKISIEHIANANAHDSFIQASEPFRNGDIFIFSCTVNVPDSSLGRTDINLLCGSAEVRLISVSNKSVSYADGTTDDYTDGAYAKFAILINTASGKTEIFKDNSRSINIDNITELYTTLDLSAIRPRVQAYVTKADSTYSVLVDDIYISRHNTDNDYHFIENSAYKIIEGNKVDASYFKNGLYDGELKIAYDKSDERKIELLLAHYKCSGSVKELEQIKTETYTLYPGINTLNLPFSVEGWSDSDEFKFFFMPNGDYNMIFSQINSYEAGKFTNPEGNQMIELLKENNSNNQHPRIWLNDSEIQRLQALIASDNIANEWYQAIKTDAAALYSKALPVYEDDDPQRLACSQTVANAIPLFSFISLIDGDTNYAQRAYEYMKAVCEFPAWEPNHFLDTSNITMAVSIGYDWLYDYIEALNDKSLSYFEENIAVKGLEMGRDAYFKTLYTQNYWWVDASTNWNVCCNSGMAIGAMAIGDVNVYSDLCGFVLEMSLDSLQKMMPSFEPDGAWFEGPSYWLSTVSPLCNMAYALESVFGTDFNIMLSKGLSNTAYYPIMNTGSKISFNLHDAGEASVDSPQLWYLGKTYNDTSVSGYRFYQLQSGICKPSFKDLLWYNPAFADDNFDDNIKKDGYFRSLELALFRNTYKGSEINFAGIHGGKNNIEHGQLDAGTFIYEAGGERWAVDLGGELYNMYNYWVMDDIEKSRWGYYRSRAEGHNTLVINPSPLADQDLECDSVIEKFVSNDSYGYSIVDLNTAYKKYASSAKRGMRIDKASGNLIVQDELTLNQISDVYWFMHTKANVELQDGGKTAVLSQNGKTLIVKINSEGTFTLMDARPMPMTVNPDEWAENINATPVPGRADTHQSINEGTRKLAIIYRDAPTGDMTISVSMGLADCYEDVSITKLNDWR